MVEAREDISCDFDESKVCPLKFAKSKVDALQADESYDSRVRGIASNLTRIDRGRLYRLIEGPNILQEGSCDSGPQKNFGFYGKVICNARI